MTEKTINPATGNLDIVGLTTSDLSTLDSRYLKLDFSNVPSSGTNGFVENGNALELWWNGTLVQSWTITVSMSGKPIGLLLGLTYP